MIKMNILDTQIVTQEMLDVIEDTFRKPEDIEFRLEEGVIIMMLDDVPHLVEASEEGINNSSLAARVMDTLRKNPRTSYKHIPLTEDDKISNLGVF